MIQYKYNESRFLKPGSMGLENGPLRSLHMSSYIDVAHPGRHAPYLDIPDDVIEYLHYLDFVNCVRPGQSTGIISICGAFFAI